jgi:hypothetical protein
LILCVCFISPFDRLAKKHGLEAADRQTFKEYFDRNATDAESQALLAKMKALEVDLSFEQEFFNRKRNVFSTMNFPGRVT